MNFLAHLHLADVSKTSLAANLAGDFAKGNISDHPQHLQQGIWLHRQMDKITDEHEIIHEVLTKFPKTHRRIAPILVDLSFDHFLARYWDEYHSQPLATFCQYAYQQLALAEQLPEKLQQIIEPMHNQDWLSAYQHRAGLNAAIEGVARRFSQPSMFVGAQTIVETMDVDLEIAFRTFYPQLMAYSKLLTRKTPAQYLVKHNAD
ncbi:ACP phosphodiesterase [Shewanella sp. NIFS-20-20]|uniref:acyl carrier protein phosphodiesterase n=1 Tax=Shewanella sp. NIFS-20-20 TaxID=2853806 RepID=UPI001C4822C1|nr:ACP phosphodiesterase [Shewanella sp. NIFS-20-20]MBV7314982.1 DUF479 domain-containing protein [Shewanella sp. NIFS-20-20]